MRRHVGTFKHLGETAKGTHDSFYQLEGGLCALAEGLCETHVVGVTGHSHAAVHASHAHTHTTHTAHASVHAAVATTVHGSVAAHAIIGRRIAAVSSHASHGASIGGSVSVGIHGRIVAGVAVRHGAERAGYLWQGRGI